MEPLRRILLHLVTPLTNASTIPIDNLHARYTVLLTTQRSVGADSLRFGFFTEEWVRLQDRYLQARGLPRRSQNEASRAIRSLILTMHDRCHTVWLLRNQHLHGTDLNNTTTSYKHLHLLAQIQELYDVLPHMMTHNRDVFAFPMEFRCLQSTAALTAFYHHAKTIAEKIIEDALKLGRNVRHIHD
jgi:hypothetical protein